MSIINFLDKQIKEFEEREKKASDDSVNAFYKGAIDSYKKVMEFLKEDKIAKSKIIALKLNETIKGIHITDVNSEYFISQFYVDENGDIRYSQKLNM